MKHARQDYQHIQDSTGRIADDEPVFLLRGQDYLFVEMLQYYRDLLDKYHGQPEMIQSLKNHASYSINWRICNKKKIKMPDLPKSKEDVKEKYIADILQLICDYLNEFEYDAGFRLSKKKQ